MAKPKIPNQRNRYAKLRGRLNKYALAVQDIYDKLNKEAAKIAMGTGHAGGVFKFSDYPMTADAVNKLQGRFVREMRGLIYAGTSAEWKESNLVQDLLASRVLKTYGAQVGGKKTKVYYQENSDALKAFQERADKGMNLSTKLWNQSGNYKQELEYAISSAIEKGTSAVTLSKRLSKYLNDFPQLKADYKEKFGQAVNCHDCEYRSIRLARSEINMAYRTAEQKRWGQMDFVVGYEIKLSYSHEVHDTSEVCERMAGKYPKDFVFVGWHPNCMCYVIPILKTEDEFWADDQTTPSVNEVTDVPDGMKTWVAENQGRIAQAEVNGTLPYWYADNRKFIETSQIDDVIDEGSVYQMQKEYSQRNASLFEQMHAGLLPLAAEETLWGIEGFIEDLDLIEAENTISRLEKAVERHANRTPEKAEEIRRKWQNRYVTRHYGENVLRLMSGIEGVDVYGLESALAGGSLARIEIETGLLVDKAKELKALTRLDNPFKVARELTFAEAKQVNASVDNFLKWLYEESDLQERIIQIQEQMAFSEDEPQFVAALKKELFKTRVMVEQEKVAKAISLAGTAKDAELTKMVDEFNAMASKRNVDLETLKAKANEINSKASQLKKPIAVDDETARVEKYCDEHRRFDYDVTDEASYEAFRLKRVDETLDPWLKADFEDRLSFEEYTGGSYSYINQSYYIDKTGCSDGERITSLIEKCKFKEDVVLRRGTDYGEIISVFGDEFKAAFDELAQTGKIDKLNKLVGSKGVNEAFMSTSFNQQGGFPGRVELRMFCPKGTQGIYAADISQCDGMFGTGWAGEKKRLFDFHDENEITLNRGYEMRLHKVELPDGTNHRRGNCTIVLYVDILTRAKRFVR